MIVILPMAGRGSRFEGSRYELPKPFIEVLGKPMFSYAIDSLKNINYKKIVIISLKAHNDHFNAKKIIDGYSLPNTELILLPKVTEGQLMTVLAAKDFIEAGDDILIASSDTIVNTDSLSTDILNQPPGCKGLISVADMEGDRWSFAQTDEKGKVIRVTEKIRISNHASTGLYYFADGIDFIKKAEAIIRNEEKTKGEYYVMPVYQKYIDEGDYIGISKADEMWDLGTPESLNIFLDNVK